MMIDAAVKSGFSAPLIERPEMNPGGIAPNRAEGHVADRPPSIEGGERTRHANAIRVSTRRRVAKPCAHWAKIPMGRSKR